MPFFGRTLIQERMLQSLSASQPVTFVVVGARLTGKSALLRHLESQIRQATAKAVSTRPLSTLLMDCASIPTAAGFWHTLAGALHISAAEESASRPTTSVEQDRQQCLSWLHTEREGRSWLLIDNLDQLFGNLAAVGELAGDLQQLAANASLVLTTQSPLFDLHRTLASAPLIGNSTQFFLGLLETEAAVAWLTQAQQPHPPHPRLTAALLELTGRHPFLLHKVGDCLVELAALLPPGQPPSEEHLPFLRLRLAEHGRSLFLAQAGLLQAPPATLAPHGVRTLVEQLRRGPLAPEAVGGELLPTLNWLINQALVTYRSCEPGFAYTVYSPLFAEFLAHTPAPARTIVNSAPPQQPPADLPFYEQLTKIEASLLRYFQQHSRDLVSTEQLLAQVWKRPDASDRRVQEAIRRLRLQLEQQQPPIGEIKNERGRGYRFIPASGGWA
jgi:hypothetical protein